MRRVKGCVKPVLEEKEKGEGKDKEGKIKGQE